LSMDSKTFAFLCDLPVKFFLVAAMLR